MVFFAEISGTILTLQLLQIYFYVINMINMSLALTNDYEYTQYGRYCPLQANSFFYDHVLTNCDGDQIP